VNNIPEWKELGIFCGLLAEEEEEEEEEW